MPSINFKRSIHNISTVWAFRHALSLQANISRRKKRPRALGNFYEFGTFQGQSLKTMGNLKKLYSLFYPELKQLKLYSFDSFEGLPQSVNESNDPVWEKGQFCGSLNEVKYSLESLSIKAQYIKGFYEESLTSKLSDELVINPPSIIHIDVDLYSSTIVVLKWLDKIALPMSLYIFDDIWAVGNHPGIGEQRAIIEYNSMSNTRGYLIESPISLGSKTIFSFTLKDYSSHPLYTK